MNRLVSNIVFTKNRPLQLEGYLGSLFKHFSEELFQTYILYKPQLFDAEYEQCFRKYSNCIVIRENDFHSDFLKLLSQIDTKYILFGIDDVVYLDPVSFDIIEACFNQFPGDIFGFSLRHSTESIKDRDDIHEFSLSEQAVYKFNWKDGKTDLTSYPFELCATIYPTALIKKIINSVTNNNPLIRKLFSPGSKVIKVLGAIISTRPILKSFGYFFSPNTLESWSCRWCQNHSQQLPKFLYFQKLCASAIQVNMVNTSTNNEANSSAEHTVEVLAEKYKQGYRFDIDAIEKNKPTGAHCGQDYFKLIKSK